jgi:hypothetical protein
MLKTTLQEPARRQKPYQLRSVNLLKTHGHPVHLQEGPNFFFYASFTKQKFKTSVRNRFKAKFLGPAQRFLQMHSHQQTQPTHLINIAPFSTLCNLTIPIPNFLNVKLYSHLSSPSAKTTVQSLIMACTFLENNTNAIPSALLYACHLTLPTTPLQSATLQKPTFIP